MSVLYKHVRNLDTFNQIDSKGGLTVAVEGVDVEVFKQSFMNLFSKDFTVTVKIGFAVCSDKDGFVKKTGRELASSRLKETQIKPIAVVRNELMFVIVGTKHVLSFALTPRNNIILTQLLFDN